MMKRCSFVLLFFCTLSLYADTVRFAPLSMEKSDTVMQQYRPMLDYLEKETGDRFSVVYSPNYADMLHKIEQKEIDLAYLGPLPYVALRKKYTHIEPLVRFLNRNGRATYTCSIITRSDSDIDSLEGLAGRTIALTQPLSTCGYLMSERLLRQAGSSMEKGVRYAYTGSHVNSALSVILGESDVGGLKSNISRKYTHFGLKVLASTSDLPGFLLVANTKTLSREQITRLRKALLALRPLENAEERALTASWGAQLRYGAIAAKRSDYDMIEEALDEITIPGGIGF